MAEISKININGTIHNIRDKYAESLKMDKNFPEGHGSVALGYNPDTTNLCTIDEDPTNSDKELIAVIGNTVIEDEYSNAFTLDMYGNAWFAGDVSVGTNQKSLATVDQIPTVPTSLKNPNSLTIKGNGTQSFTYDGSSAKTLNIKAGNSIGVSSNTSGDITINTSNALLGQGYGTCLTAESDEAKVVTLPNYSLVIGGFIAVKFTYSVPANATMNINNKGAKAIYYKGKAIVGDIINANEVAYFIYDGTYYHLLGVDRNRFFTSLVPYGTAIKENDDLNTTNFLKVGNYYCSTNEIAETLLNCPTITTNTDGTKTGVAFTMIVSSPLSQIVDDENGAQKHRFRILQTYNGPQYTQYCHSDNTAGNWIYGEWHEVIKSNGGTIKGNIVFNNNSSKQKDEPNLTWKKVTSSSGDNIPYLGFAQDQTDGTFLWSLRGTEWQTGLAIGGGSTNLLWKGNRVLDTTDLGTTIKPLQDSVLSPSASGDVTTAFIDTISQDKNGKITATKKNIPPSLKNPNALTIEINGTQSLTYDGSSPQTLNLGTAAQTNSDDYATSAQGTKADNALPKSGGNVSGHIYLTGAQANSSTGNTSQIVFGTNAENGNHVVISSNTGALVINPTTSTTTNQIVLYLNKASVFPSGISANVTGNLTGTASKATADADGNTITSTYAKLASPTFTGTPKAPTASKGTNTTQIATTAFVQTGLADKAPMYTYGTEDLTSGVSPLATGTLHFVYE